MKPVYVGIPQGKVIEREKVPEGKPALPENIAKPIFNRIAHIVIEDIRYFFGRKAVREAIEKSREDKMRYDEFMERFRK